MKWSKYFKKSVWLVLLFMLLGRWSHAQNSMIDALQHDKPNEGKVRIKLDPGIHELIGKMGGMLDDPLSNSFYTSKGYRISVYLGNRRESRDEATTREQQIKEFFPYLRTEKTYDAPFWKVKVGDFTTEEQAKLFQQQLKSVFKTFSQEIIIVKDDIKIPIN